MLNTGSIKEQIEDSSLEMKRCNLDPCDEIILTSGSNGA